MGFDYLYPYWVVRAKFLEKTEKFRTAEHYRRQFRKARRANRKTVYLVMTPEHENLGDHAIAYAQTRLLKEHDISWVEITFNQLQELDRLGQLHLMNGRPILINGGGNMGTLWTEPERLHRRVIQENPKSPVFILPNTIFYEDSPWGQEDFRNSVAIYNQHSALYLYAREKTSFETMKAAYQNVKLIPDMVLSLDESGHREERSGCLICLRFDKEKTLTEQQHQTVLSQAESLFAGNVRKTDTVIDRNVSPQEREQTLKEKFREFSAAQLVITDRLHGMIFCAITGTPCILLGSKSPKIRGCYEWIQNLPYIWFAEQPEQIGALYRQMAGKETHYDNSHLRRYYQELAEDILTKNSWR